MYTIKESLTKYIFTIKLEIILSFSYSRLNMGVTTSSTIIDMQHQSLVEVCRVLIRTDLSNNIVMCSSYADVRMTN